jgi:hypothetical protein
VRALTMEELRTSALSSPSPASFLLLLFLTEGERGFRCVREVTGDGEVARRRKERRRPALSAGAGRGRRWRRRPAHSQLEFSPLYCLHAPPKAGVLLSLAGRFVCTRASRRVGAATCSSPTSTLPSPLTRATRGTGVRHR